MDTKLRSLSRKLLSCNGFPAFCAALVGGYTFLQWPIRLFYDGIQRLGRLKLNDPNGNTKQFVSRFLAALLSSWCSLHLLNIGNSTKLQQSRDSTSDEERRSSITKDTSNVPEVPGVYSPPLPLVGTTIDLTVLAAVRAFDTTIVNLCRPRKTAAKTARARSSAAYNLSRHGDSLIFAISSGVIMWAWFYLPDRVPQAYNKWIGEAAQVDERLIHLLREAKEGRLIYGKNTGHAPILQGMCNDYGWPLSWGDPETTIPIPCEVVHMGTGPSCHWNAILRATRALRFALATNLPLQILAKSRRSLSIETFRRACGAAIQSSAFLGAFVGFFYYGVCLSRTILGPKIFDYATVTPMTWDSGLCITTGCILCGWSILIEAVERRPELALFVAPRALAIFLPRQYHVKVCYTVKRLIDRLV